LKFLKRFLESHKKDKSKGNNMGKWLEKVKNWCKMTPARLAYAERELKILFGIAPKAIAPKSEEP